jgi:DNA-3-methyladenine glycosylase II
MRANSDNEASAAVNHLLTVDSRLAALVETQGLVDPYHWDAFPSQPGDMLSGLVVHIVGQQIATRVAVVVFERIKQLLGGEITSATLALATIEELRSTGISGAKARALSELGARLEDGNFDLEALKHKDDVEAELDLVSLRGIGPWSAQMFLIHELRRPNVFPAGDVGLRSAIARLDELPSAPDIKSTVQRAAIWAPYRTYAAGYLWSWLSAVRQQVRESSRTAAASASETGRPRS